MVDMQGTSDNLQLKKDYKFNQINTKKVLI